MNSLEPNETDFDKITDVTHKCLLIMSVRDAAEIINSREKTKGDDVDDEKEKMKLFDEIVQNLIQLNSNQWGKNCWNNYFYFS